MALTDTTGVVTYIKINKQASEGQDLCFFGLRPTGSTRAELFILWWALSSGQPTPTAADWVLRNVCIGMLRDSFINRIPITVATDDVSALVVKVQLGTGDSGI
jgi:hypothetical protein